ncbi:unnamed protein product [Sympodiomycopsis kandeliae]
MEKYAADVTSKFKGKGKDKQIRKKTRHTYDKHMATMAANTSNKEASCQARSAAATEMLSSLYRWHFANITSCCQMLDNALTFEGYERGKAERKKSRTRCDSPRIKSENWAESDHKRLSLQHQTDLFLESLTVTPRRRDQRVRNRRGGRGGLLGGTSGHGTTHSVMNNSTSSNNGLSGGTSGTTHNMAKNSRIPQI